MSESPPLDHGVQTRDRILETAARLFSENGYESTALSHVAREAQVSKALVLWHFASKEKLFRAALGRTLEPYFINVEDLEGLGERARIEKLVDQFYDFVCDNVYSVRFLLSLVARGDKQADNVIERVNQLYQVFRAVMADTLESGRRSGTFRADVQPALDAGLILATLAGILIEHILSGDLPGESSDLLDHLKGAALNRLIA